MKVKAIWKSMGRGNFYKLKGVIATKKWNWSDKRSGHLNYKFLHRQ